MIFKVNHFHVYFEVKIQVIEIISHKSIKIILNETFLMDLEIYFALLTQNSVSGILNFARVERSRIVTRAWEGIERSN